MVLSVDDPDGAISQIVQYHRKTREGFNPHCG